MSLVVFNARSAGGAPVELHIRDGRFVASAEAAERFDAGGRLALPGLVEGHVHLDKTLIGLPFIPHIPGDSIAARIAAERQLRRSVPLSIEAQGGLLIERLSAYGTTALRSHVDIDAEAGLSGLEALLKLKARCARLVDMQIVAFPQSGVLSEPGVADLLDAAVRDGADLVGGLDPAGIDGDAAAHLDVIFAVAERRGAGVDIHLHDRGALGARELQMIAERTAALSLGGSVTVSHAFCLGELDDALFGETASALARAGVAIMTTAPGPVPAPPVKRLRAAGVRVFSGSDNIRDAWSPFGNGDLIERAGIVCDRQGFRADAGRKRGFPACRGRLARRSGGEPSARAHGFQAGSARRVTRVFTRRARASPRGRWRRVGAA